MSKDTVQVHDVRSSSLFVHNPNESNKEKLSSSKTGACSIDAMSAAYKLKILIVEDSAAIQKVMRRWLESNGCIVTSAENGKVGLELLKLHSFDISFMDFLMVRF